MLVQPKVVPEREDSVPVRAGARLRGFILALLAGVMAALISLTASSVRSEQHSLAPKNSQAVTDFTPNQPTTPPTTKQKGEARRLASGQTQDDAAALCNVANQLRDELNKMNAYVFPLDVLHKTEEVERLARKIRGEANKH